MTGNLNRRTASALLAGGLMLVLALVLNGCAASLIGGGAPQASVSGSAGTQVAQASGQPGIGGTGGANDKSPGIGGTGHVAGASPGIGGTGIIGTVTGFGSIFVNGFEVEYAPDLPVTFKDRTVRPDALRIGQVVEIEAQGSGQRLRARTLAVRLEVAGPIERIDPARRIAVVFGQRIEIPEGVVSSGNGSQAMKFNALAVGDYIDVSGLRRANGVIAASRIDKAKPGETAVLRGRVTASGQSGFSVNGMRIDTPVGSRPGTLSSGRDVQIIGTASGGRLRARRIRQLGQRPFEGRVRQLSVEGYVRRAISGGAAVGRIPITQLPAGASIQARQRVILDGKVDGRGRFAPARLRKPRIKLRHPRRAPVKLNNPPAPVRRQVLPPVSRQPVSRPPVYRAPAPVRPRVYRPAPRRPGR